MKSMDHSTPVGKIAAPPETSSDTLDEPISDTLVGHFPFAKCPLLIGRPLKLRDAKLIGTKLRYVLIPAGSRNELRNCKDR